jgi:choline dehydrogenase-like flavoprotein
VGAGLGGQIPLLEGLPPMNEDGAGGAHLYAPWWLYREQAAGKLDFPRGYHIEFGAERGPPDGSGIGEFANLTGGSYGRRLKEEARRYYGSFMYFSGRGEMIPNDKSYCELDPAVKDRWGIPVLRFHWQWSDHELRQVRHMQRTFSDLVGAMGGRLVEHPKYKGLQGIAQGGVIIHEVGGAMMGTGPAGSATDRWGQTWDVKNLFLADGATFCSNADKNPTLTIMALAWRCADRIVEQLRRNNL